jgi:hypothetical protein
MVLYVNHCKDDPAAELDALYVELSFRVAAIHTHIPYSLFIAKRSETDDAAILSRQIRPHADALEDTTWIATLVHRLCRKLASSRYPATSQGITFGTGGITQACRCGVSQERQE